MVTLEATWAKWYCLATLLHIYEGLKMATRETGEKLYFSDFDRVKSRKLKVQILVLQPDRVWLESRIALHDFQVRQNRKN